MCDTDVFSEPSTTMVSDQYQITSFPGSTQLFIICSEQSMESRAGSWNGSRAGSWNESRAGSWNESRAGSWNEASDAHLCIRSVAHNQISHVSHSSFSPPSFSLHPSSSFPPPSLRPVWIQTLIVPHVTMKCRADTSHVTVLKWPDLLFKWPWNLAICKWNYICGFCMW